uniref:Uncharacterized protein n=1 Tax=Meloidogyne javanica TaxID=6303 RepID=A0A915MXT6_MELJA
LKNIPYSGRKCNKPGQHGLRIRVCARRTSFTRDDVNHNYTINYKIFAKLGFTYSHKTFVIEKNETIFGSINKITKLLEPPLKKDATISIFTILLGTNDTLFAKLVDGNGKELFDYTPSAKFLISMLFKNGTGNEKTIQKIADEGNEALPLLGVDMEGWNEGPNLLDAMEFPDNPCHLILKFNANKINSTNQCVRI